MKRITLLQLGFLVALAPACGDDTSSSSDTEEDTEDDSDSDSESMTMTTTTTTTTSSTTDAPTTGETEGPTTGETEGPTTGETEGPTTGDTDSTTTSDTDSTTTSDTDSTSTGETEGESSSSTGPGNICGDDVIGDAEECDGLDLGGAACPFFGDIACADDCTLDVSACDDTLVMCSMTGGALDATTTAAAPLLDAVTVAADGFVSDVNVQLQVTHPYVGDVVSVLVSPDPAEGSVLMDGNGCDDAQYADVDATFDDETGIAPACGTPAFSGPIAPVTALNRLIGINSVGDWTLAAWDDFSAVDDGSLTQWCVELTLSEDDPRMCGDAIAHYGEPCDGADLKGADCLDAGDFVGGVLACAGDCTYDTTTCIAPGCGNDILEDGEDCDGAALGDTVCADLPGFSSGELACAGDCTFDTTNCVASPPGDTCGDAIIIDETALPYTNSDDTLNYSNDYGYSAGACPGETGGFNAGSEDIVYQITPATTGVYTIEFDASFDATVYTVTDCADIDNTCVGGADNGNPETIVTELTAGTTYYIIGGHWSNTTPGSGGTFTINVSDACIPVCDDVSCDIDDGCGGLCGCADGDTCLDGTCGTPITGDQCGDPLVVGALPYTDTGDVNDYQNDYGYSTGVCPGETSGWNSGAEDVVYSFTPAADGDYDIVFDTTWDSTVYVATDCDDIDNSCVGGADNGNPETVTATLTGGTTYFIIGGHWSNASGGGGDTYTLTVDVASP